MSHFVRLEVVVDREFCGDDCPLLTEHVRPKAWCALTQVALYAVSADSPKSYYRRTDACLAATAIDEKERAAIEAAELHVTQQRQTWGRLLHETRASGLGEAVDALSALRDEGTDEQHARGRK
jgi:hypothetical protein